MKKILIFFLAFLGISACVDGPCMYGTPYSDFSLKGKVTDENLAPLSEIGIEISSQKHVLDTVYTIGDGSYAYQNDFYTCGNGNKMKIKAFDPDSVYKEQSVEIELNFAGSEKGNMWYEGHADATQNFKLTKK